MQILINLIIISNFSTVDIAEIHLSDIHIDSHWNAYLIYLGVLLHNQPGGLVSDQFPITCREDWRAKLPEHEPGCSKMM